jgi:hypothetical protein
MSDDKALRIANALEYASNNLRSVNHQAAAELRRLYAEVERLRAQQAEQDQEPYCYVYEYDSAFGLHQEFYPGPYNGKQKPDRAVPVYTHPPRREWVSLTDEELRKMHHEDQFGLFCDYDEFEQIARAIEAALKEKNA